MAGFGAAGLVGVFLTVAVATGPGGGWGSPSSVSGPTPGPGGWSGGGGWVLVVTNGEARTVARWVVEPGQEVQLEYLHSMFRVPVRERFRITPAGLGLVAVEAPSPDIAWYYGGGPEGRWRMERLDAAPPLACGDFRWTPGPDAAWYRLAGPGMRPAPVPVVTLRVRATRIGHRSLVIRGRCVRLSELVGIDGEAMVTVRPGT